MSVYDKNLKSLQSKYKKIEESFWDNMESHYSKLISKLI